MADSTKRQTIERRFSAAASTYDHYARVQRSVAEESARLLRIHAPPPACILDIGCGTGAVIQALGSDYALTGLDISQAMITEACLKNPGDIDWIHSDILEYTCDTPYDILVSASTLHWLRPLDDLFAHLQGLLVPGGLAVFALMLDGSLSELHALRAAYSPGKQKGPLPGADEVADAMNRSGFSVASTHFQSFKSHYPEAATLIRHLHNSGVTARTTSKALTRGELNELTQAYDTLVRDAKGVYATWQVGYFIGRNSTRP
ncbi:MAG: methyltransferase domain-containing protein [Verrucomicrobiota bacterium]